MRLSKGLAVLQLPWSADNKIRTGKVVKVTGQNITIDFGPGTDLEIINRHWVVPDCDVGWHYAHNAVLALRLRDEEDRARHEAVRPILEKYAPLIDAAYEQIRIAARELEARYK